MTSTSTSASKMEPREFLILEDIRNVLLDYIQDLAILYSDSKDDTYSKKVAHLRLLLQEVS